MTPGILVAVGVRLPGLADEGLASLLAYQDGFVVVDEAEDTVGPLTQARALAPDIVLMDIDLLGEDGWIGAVVAYLVLGVSAATSQDALTLRATWLATEVIGW